MFFMVLLAVRRVAAQLSSSEPQRPATPDPKFRSLNRNSTPNLNLNLTLNLHP